MDIIMKIKVDEHINNILTKLKKKLIFKSSEAFSENDSEG